MIAGSFCFRKEVEQFADWVFWSLRGTRYMLRRSGTIRGVIDTFAGTGCLTEIILRMGQLKGSYCTIEYVMLVDTKPWPVLTRYFTMFMLRMLPVLPRSLELRVLWKGKASKEERLLAQALNELLKNREKETLYSGSVMPYIRKSMTLKMEPVFLRWMRENGLVTLYLRDAREFIKRLESSAGKKWRKSGMGFMIDPPRKGSDYKRYGTRERVGLEVLREIDRHEAGYAIYIDYKEAIEEVIQELSFMKIAGVYRLYNPIYSVKKKGDTDVYAVLLTKEGINYLPEAKRRFAWETEPEIAELVGENFLEDYNERRRSGKHVWERYKRKDEYLIKQIARDLPPYDWLKRYFSDE